MISALLDNYLYQNRDNGFGLKEVLWKRGDLVVGDDHAGGDAQVLQRHAFADGAEVMAQMQPARGAIAREHAVFAGIDGKVGANLIAAFLAGFEAIAHHALTFIVRREFSSCSSIALMPDAGAHHLKAFDTRP